MSRDRGGKVFHEETTRYEAAQQDKLVSSLIDDLCSGYAP